MYTCFFLSFGPLLPTVGFRVVGLLVGVLQVSFMRAVSQLGPLVDLHSA